MDVFRFLESNAIKNYWKRIGFIPDPLQMAYLVFCCDNHEITFNEKQSAYQEIMNSAGEYIIKPRPWFAKECSLKGYINELLELQNEYVNKFYAPGGDAFYVGNIFVSKYKTARPSRTYYFKTFEELKDNYYPLDNNEHIVISRCVPGYGKKPITISFNNNFDIAGIGIFGESAEGDDGEILFGLNGFFFDFPYPFKIGDLVFSNITGPSKPLLIIEDPKKDEKDIKRFLKEGDDTDMSINCVPLGEKRGRYTHNPLLNLDYYDERNYMLDSRQKIIKEMYMNR